MKNLVLSIFFVTFLFSSVSAQIGKGYYITFDNDTVYVDFIGAGLSKPNLREMTWNAIYLNEEGKRTDLSPKVAKEIFFEFKNTGNSYRLISFENTLGFHSPPNRSGKRFFAEPLIEGKLSLYIYRYHHGIPGTYSFSYDNIGFWLLDGNLHFALDQRPLRKNPQIISDCPELVSMLKNKDKSVKSYVQITKMYNSLCGKTEE